jgi:hypothetical protein
LRLWFGLRLPVDPQHFDLGARRFDSLDQFGHDRRLPVTTKLGTVQKLFRLLERIRKLGEPSRPSRGSCFNRYATHVRPPAMNSMV